MYARNKVQIIQWCSLIFTWSFNYFRCGHTVIQFTTAISLIFMIVDTTYLLLNFLQFFFLQKIYCFNVHKLQFYILVSWKVRNTYVSLSYTILRIVEPINILTSFYIGRQGFSRCNNKFFGSDSFNNLVSSKLLSVFI